jgi:putative membrane protein
MKRLVIAAALAAFAVPAAAQQSTTTTTVRPQSSQSSVSELTSRFMTTAAISDRFEIQSSQIAMQQARSDEVKEFAESMVEDHSGTTEDLLEFAQDKGVRLPDQVDARHQQLLAQLQQAPAGSFDATYVQQQVQAHREAVQLFEQYAQSGDDEELKEWAEDTVPTLREHLQEAQQLAQSMPMTGAAGATGGAPQGSGGTVVVPTR